MKQLFTGWVRRPLALVLSFVMSAGLLVPAASLATEDRTLRGGDGRFGGGGDEGDPLDSNDHDTGGSDDEIHSDSVGGLTVPLIPILAEGRSILLIPEFQSGILVFRIMIVEAEPIGSEE